MTHFKKATMSKLLHYPLEQRNPSQLHYKLVILRGIFCISYSDSLNHEMPEKINFSHRKHLDHYFFHQHESPFYIMYIARFEITLEFLRLLK